MAATFELHSSQSPIFRYAPSLSTVQSHSTPVKNTTINSLSETKSAVKELLWSEMSRGGWVQDDRLTEHFKEGPRRVPELVIPPAVASEDELYAPLATYFNAIVRRSSLRIIDTSKYSPRASQDESKDLPESPDFGPVKQSRLRPDLIGMREEDATAFTESVDNKLDGETCLYWILVRLVCEVKKHCTPGCWLEAREQAALYARQIFRNHAGRRFVYAIVWCHPKFELWLFDPSGGVVSGQYEIFDGPATKRTLNKEACGVLARVIYSLSQFDDAAMGYDPNLTVPSILPSQSLPAPEPYKDAVITFPATDSHPEEHFKLISELFSRNSLRGRGTRAWLVERQHDGKKFVLKDSWQESVRIPEWEWYDKVPADQRSSLADVYRYCTVSIHGQPDTTELARGSCGIKDKQGRVLADLQLRVHHRILFATVGELLKESKDFNEVLRCVAGAVKAHQALFKEGILHRDISVNNILIDKERGTGILIDMDLAAKVEADSDGGVISNHRSGTLLFMAHEVMAGRYSGVIGQKTPFRHGAQHDLESFVWVLLYVAVTTRGYESALQSFQEGINGLAADMFSLAAKKFVFWNDTYGSWNMTGEQLTKNPNGAHPLWNTIDGLHQVLQKIQPGPQPRPVLDTLYDKFIRTLEKGIVHPKRPMPDPETPTTRKRSKSTALRTSGTLRTRTTAPDYHA